MRAIIVTGPYTENILNQYKPEQGDFIIGADQGALHLIDLNIPFDVALGDFDSVTPEQKKKIDHYAKSVKKYPIKKDFTDTDLAIQVAQEKGFETILIFGGLGARFDHSLANMYLLTRGDITLYSQYEKMYVLYPGKYTITNDYPYISFFALETVEELTLTDFEYELDSITLKVRDPLCISNQGSGTLSFSSGLLLVIHERD